MNKPPAFQFYAKDWRSSSTVRSMTREQRGDFIDMLAASWDQEEPGTLPLPIELSAKICGISARSLRKFVETFPKLWQIDGDRLVNPKLRAQWEELQQLKRKQADAAKKTNEQYWKRASVSDSVSDRSAPASASASASAKSLAHAVISRSEEPETAGASPTRSQIDKAIRRTAKHLDPTVSKDPRAHLEAGIYRKKIEAAYFDAARAGMKPDECIRECANAAALCILGNRSVELRGLSDKDLAASAWQRMRSGNGLEALYLVKDPQARSRQVVAVVTRCVTDLALEFLTNAPSNQACGVIR